jgi:hypothetical protein
MGQLSSSSAQSDRVCGVVTKALSSLGGRESREADEIQRFASDIVPECVE